MLISPTTTNTLSTLGDTTVADRSIAAIASVIGEIWLLCRFITSFIYLRLIATTAHVLTAGATALLLDNVTVVCQTALFQVMNVRL